MSFVTIVMKEKKGGKREMEKHDTCCTHMLIKTCKQGDNWKDLKGERTRAMSTPGRCAPGKGTVSVKA